MRYCRKKVGQFQPQMKNVASEMNKVVNNRPFAAYEKSSFFYRY